MTNITKAARYLRGTLNRGGAGATGARTRGHRPHVSIAAGADHGIQLAHRRSQKFARAAKRSVLRATQITNDVTP